MSVRISARRDTLIQIAILMVIAAIALLATRWIISQVLVHEALVKEADHYFSRRSIEPDFQLPDTDNLHGYLGGQPMPEVLHGLSAGYHELQMHPQGQVLVYVEARGDQTLYLVFDNQQVGQLTLLFGLLPIAVATLPVWALFWYLRRRTHRVVSPYRDIARYLRTIDVTAPDLAAAKTREMITSEDEDVRVMVDALDTLTHRIAQFIRREREFTLDASHELRTPLTVILAAANVAQLAPNCPQPVQEQLQIIVRAVQRLRGQLQALLMLSREQAFPESLVDLAKVLREQVEAHSAAAASKGIRFEVDVSGQYRVTTSEQAVGIIVGNVLANAVKYSPGGVVHATVRDGNIIIRDQGVGMGERTAEQLFKPFFRGGDPSAHEGMGVGMNIVARLAERLDARIYVNSQPEQGTRVDVVLT
ncbi:MAG: sensor histidine kinase [Lysobacteraceae bacterium]|nr:MAG: sensor histidine kinase [Xanthomonadaceae bacterium]